MQWHNISSIQSFIHYVLSCIPVDIFMDLELFCDEAPSTSSFPSLNISMASGDNHHSFVFKEDLECGPFILMGEFTLPEWGSVTPKFSGISLSSGRWRHLWK